MQVKAGAVARIYIFFSHFKQSNKTDYPIRCTHIYNNRLADLPVDDSRISSEMLVDSGQQLFVIDKLENIKTLNNGPVPLGLKLTIYVIKSQIHFVRQSLFLWRGVYFYSKAADLVLPTHFNIFQPERPKKFNK